LAGGGGGDGAGGGAATGIDIRSLDVARTFSSLLRRSLRQKRRAARAKTWRRLQTATMESLSQIFERQRKGSKIVFLYVQIVFVSCIVFICADLCRHHVDWKKP
jgi:hypothetical protein